MSQTATAIQQSLRFAAPHWCWAVALHATWSFLILKWPFHSSVSNLTSPSAVAAKLRRWILDWRPLLLYCGFRATGPLWKTLTRCFCSGFLRLCYIDTIHYLWGLHLHKCSTKILEFSHLFCHCILLLRTLDCSCFFFLKLLFSRFVKVKAAHLALDVVLTSDTIDWFLSHSDSNKIAVHCG